MHPYRTHTCGEIRKSHVGDTVRISGWVFRRRDHGHFLFIDLRDHYGITQVVFHPERDFFEKATHLKYESVITITGKVIARGDGTVNPAMATGEIEVVVDELVIQSMAETLPMLVDGKEDSAEDLRLKYRFLDLRRDKLHKNIMLRTQIISSLRRRMTDSGFAEFQTPILTSSSPEGARDYLVPSRIHPGKFYALPQAPQQFKQLLMVAGFDRYFQIAPCFRDEDARADRSPGEFYQLDIEMSFVTQDDVFAAVEHVIGGLFQEFAKKKVDAAPFVRISYADSMLKYGNDKPDLRIPIEIRDVGALFAESEFSAFKTAVAAGAVVRAIPVKNVADKPRSFFDKLVEYAQSVGSKGLAYLVWSGETVKGPLFKFLKPEQLQALRAKCGAGPGDAIFFQGDEIALEDGKVPDERITDLADPPRDPERTPLPWTRSGEEWSEPWLPLENTKRNVEAQRADPDSTLNFVRDVIAQRKQFSDDSYETLKSVTGVWAYRRGDKTCLLNMTDDVAGHEGQTLEPWQGLIL